MVAPTEGLREPCRRGPAHARLLIAASSLYSPASVPILASTMPTHRLPASLSYQAARVLLPACPAFISPPEADMTATTLSNPPAAATPRRLAALVLLAVAAGACDAPDAATSFDGAAAFAKGGVEASVVCHYAADANTWSPLTLPKPAVQAHLRHGDALPGDRLSDDSGVFGPSCEAIADPPAWPALVEIDAPSAAAGQYAASIAAFGSEVTLAGVSGAVVLVSDGVGAASDACEALVGFPAGAIALVDRGSCLFVVKAANAQAAGATAMVVVNNVAGDPATMGGDDPGIVIPLVMVSLTDGSAIKAGLPATGTVRRNP
jgi:hypothetical protein